MAQANFALLGVVGSTFATPKEFTLASPSYNQYWASAHVVTFGDCTQLPTAPAVGNNGIVPTGYCKVEFHSNNQWVTGTIYTNQSGSTMAGLFG